MSHSDAEYQLMLYSQMLDEIAELGATDVQLPIRWAQPDHRSADLSPRRGLTPSDAVLGQVIDEAHRRKLRVFLMPMIHLERRDKGIWRGRIDPAEPDAWWAAYRRFIQHYAELGARHGVHLFAVGSELVSLERFNDRWQTLIADTRTRFKGLLTYSANWDHFEPVPFWDQLDVVGVTAYQPLMQGPADVSDLPTVDTLASGWRPLVQRLRGWAMRQNRRYLFTEVGFPAHTYGAARPWDHSRSKGEPAPELQARCLESLVQVWRTDDRLQGVFVWNWFGVGGTQDRGYSPRDRRGASVIKAWFDAW